jgi:hypothetical protein
MSLQIERSTLCSTNSANLSQRQALASSSAARYSARSPVSQRLSARRRKPFKHKLRVSQRECAALDCVRVVSELNTQGLDRVGKNSAQVSSLAVPGVGRFNVSKCSCQSFGEASEDLERLRCEFCHGEHRGVSWLARVR